MADLNDPKQGPEIQKIMKAGYHTEFWGLIAQALDENLKNITEQLRGDELDQLSPDAYRIECNVLRAKKKYIEELKNLPKAIFLSCSSAEGEQEEFDPYKKPEDFLPKE